MNFEPCSAIFSNLFIVIVGNSLFINKNENTFEILNLRDIVQDLQKETLSNKSVFSIMSYVGEIKILHLGIRLKIVSAKFSRYTLKTISYDYREK